MPPPPNAEAQDYPVQRRPRSPAQAQHEPEAPGLQSLKIQVRTDLWGNDELEGIVCRLSLLQCTARGPGGARFWHIQYVYYISMRNAHLQPTEIKRVIFLAKNQLSPFLSNIRGGHNFGAVTGPGRSALGGQK